MNDDFKLVKMYNIPFFGITGCFSPDNKYAYAINNRTIRQLQIDTGHVSDLVKVPARTSIISNLYCTPTGNELLFAIEELQASKLVYKILSYQISSGNINVYNNMYFENFSYIDAAFKNNCLLMFKERYDEKPSILTIINLITGSVIFNKLFEIRISPSPEDIGFSDRYVAVPTVNQIKIFDIINKNKIFSLRLARAKNVTFSPDGKYLVCTANSMFDDAPDENTFYMLNFYTGDIIRKINLGNNYIFGLHFSPSGLNVFIDLDGSDFLFYNIPTGQMLTFSRNANEEVEFFNGSTVSNDLNYIISRGNINTALWKVV